MLTFLRYCILLTALVLGLPCWLATEVLNPTFHIPEIYREAYIKSAAQLPNSQYVVAGTFTHANGQLRASVVGAQSQSIFRLLPSGALAPSFRPAASLLLHNHERLAVQPEGQLVVFFYAYAPTYAGSRSPMELR